MRIDRAAMDYQAFYCEENVWRLLARPELREAATWAVIVSNPRREVILLRQRSGRPVDGLVHWDYHVFAVASDPIQGRLALDLDSELPFPCPLRRYIDDSFPEGIQSSFAPRFRLLKGVDYSSHLVSDRSHMRRPDGSWLAPPPPWPAPGALSGLPNTLMKWADLSAAEPGFVYDRARLAAFAANEDGARRGIA